MPWAIRRGTPTAPHSKASAFLKIWRCRLAVGRMDKRSGLEILLAASPETAFEEVWPDYLPQVVSQRGGRLVTTSPVRVQFYR